MRRIVGAVLLALPERVLVRVLPRRYRWDPSTTTVPPHGRSSERRLLIAPVNWAGQGDAWARSVECHLRGVVANSMAYRVGGEFGHPVDQSVPVGAYVASKTWQRAQRDAVLADFTHVLVEAVRAPFGSLRPEAVVEQIDMLRQQGLAVAMVCHGSDVRLPSRHRAHNGDSPFHPGRLRGVAALERDVEWNLTLLNRIGAPVYVSTPDLVIDVPDGRWLPVVVDTTRWVPGKEEPLTRAVPVVVHAPSNPAMKGSDVVDPLMQALHDQGVIEYRRLHGISAADMVEAIRSADIVLEQFRLGSYGVAACEAMASGRVVVGNVSEQVRQYVREATGRDVPIVHSAAHEVASVIRRLIDDRDLARGHAAAGRSFVAAVHDGRRSAKALSGFLNASAV